MLAFNQYRNLVATVSILWLGHLCFFVFIYAFISLIIFKLRDVPMAMPGVGLMGRSALLVLLNWYSNDKRTL